MTARLRVSPSMSLKVFLVVLSTINASIAGKLLHDVIIHQKELPYQRYQCQKNAAQICEEMIKE